MATSTTTYNNCKFMDAEINMADVRPAHVLLASRQGNIPLLKEAIRWFPDMVDHNWSLEREFQYEQVDTALCEAIYHQQHEAVTVLLDLGKADVNLDYGYSPLGAAVRKNDGLMMEILLSRGADPAKKDRMGWSPLEEARHENKEWAIWLMTRAAAAPHK